MYQQNEDNLGTKDESGYFVSAAYKLDNNITLKAQYGAIEDDVDGDEEQTLSLGADYKLAKNTKVFAFLHRQYRLRKSAQMMMMTSVR